MEDSIFDIGSLVESIELTPDFGDISFNRSDYVTVDHSQIVAHKGLDSDSILSAGNFYQKRVSFNNVGENNKMYIGSGADIGSLSISFNGSSNIVVIGSNVRLKNVQFSIKGKGSVVIIGAGTTWESGQCICDSGCSIIIGKDCMFSNHVMIRTSDAHGIFDVASKKLLNPPGSVVIGCHVWLGNSARVNKSSMIGSNTILGGGSVARGRLDPSSVYAGVPAKQVRKNVIWSRTYSMEDIPDDFL